MAKKCIKCGVLIDDSAIFCGECGSKQYVAASNEADDDATVMLPDENTDNKAAFAPQYQQSFQNVPPAGPYSNRQNGVNNEPVGVPDKGGKNDREPDKNGMSTLNKILLVVIFLLIVVAAAVALFVYPGFLKNKKEKTDEKKSENSETALIELDTSEAETAATTGYVTGNEQSTTANTVGYDTDTSETETEPIVAPTYVETDSTYADASETDAYVTTSETKQSSDFEIYAIPLETKLYKELEFNTCVAGNTAVNISGKLTFTSAGSYNLTQETIDTGKEIGIDLAGYKSVTLEASITFDESVLNGREPAIVPVFFDYYDIESHSKSKQRLFQDEVSGFLSAKITIGGKTKGVYLSYGIQSKAVNGSVIYICEFEYYVPADYDGAVIGFVSGTMDTDNILDNYSPFFYKLFKVE